MASCPTTRIKNKFGPGYAIKNTADLTDEDELWIDPEGDVPPGVDETFDPTPVSDKDAAATLKSTKPRKSAKKKTKKKAARKG
jgi:hypothetical protein